MTEDDALLAELRGVFADLDPVPAHVVAAGEAALAWREVDALLATLVADSATVVTAGVRGSVSRLLTFSGADVSVEIEVSGEGAELDIVGQLAPPALAEVHVRLSRGELTCRADPTGHFVVSGVPVGPVSLVFRLPDATSIVTSWVCV